MRIIVKSGDILDERVDVLVSTANPQLNMSGGVNGAILQRGGAAVQAELRAYLKLHGRNWVEPGSVIRTGPGPLPVRHILHAVAVDAFYGSSAELVRRTIACALRLAAEQGAATVALPALATGYGPLSMGQFADALRQALADGRHEGLDELRVVLASDDDAAVVRGALGAR